MRAGGLPSAVALLALLVPLASAGVPFVLEYEDPVGDNAAASADVVRVSSSVREGRVTQRIEMAAAPDAERDTVIARSWFHNSTNGSFHVVDLEIHARVAEEQKFRALVRRDEYENATPLAATWAIEGNAWVFSFDEAPFADATCFDPIVWAQHEPENGTWSADVGGVGARHCRVRGDPTPEPPAAPSAPPRVFHGERDQQAAAEPPLDPPGTYAPGPLPWLAVGAALALGLLTRRTGRRR